MPLDSTTVDIISKAMPGSPFKVLLWIVDDGTVIDQVQRYELLIKKLKLYWIFVGTPQFRKDFPDTRSGDVQVRVVCKTPPTVAMSDIHAVGEKGEDDMRVVF